MSDVDEVVLASEGTPMARFQAERTDAATKMFDGAYANGLYPTSRFYARLDSCVRELLADADRDHRFAEAVRAAMDESEVRGRYYGATIAAILKEHDAIYGAPCTQKKGTTE